MRRYWAWRLKWKSFEERVWDQEIKMEKLRREGMGPGD